MHEREKYYEDPVLENLTRTVIYEGYSIFPYHRSAVKNQKPIPFGVIYPEKYHINDPHAPSLMRTECIVVGAKGTAINITVRFLHLITTQSCEPNEKSDNSTFGNGWQTIERRIHSEDLLLAELVHKNKILPIAFDKIDEKESWDKEKAGVKSKQINSVSEIKGEIILDAFPVENKTGIYRLRVTVKNNTSVENSGTISRDEALRQSFLSTNTILKITNGELISCQNPPEDFKDIIAKCESIGTWPILIDESHTTMLSSPMILYDYPKINPQSQGDLFDSLEIEEMLILHLSAMSDEEKEKIAETDAKIRAMLDKARQVTPAELLNLHGGMFENKQFKI